jgi:hypothetical protein
MELRSLVTIPFLTPMNMMNIQQARAAAAAQAAQQTAQFQQAQAVAQAQAAAAAHAAASSQQRLSMATGAANLESSPGSRPSSPIATATSPHPIKRQTSRSRMTPQQAAVAMANGMIAANMAAVVNGSTNQNNRNAVQLALVAAQQQQLQQQQQAQQQQQRGNNNTNGNGMPSSIM